MAEYHLIADQAGERADAFLARSIEGLTRSAAQRLLEEGAAVCGGKTWKKNSKTRAFWRWSPSSKNAPVMRKCCAIRKNASALSMNGSLPNKNSAFAKRMKCSSVSASSR